GRKDAKFSEVFSGNRNINWLSASRLFLFGARDVWFVVGVPIYFYAVISDGSDDGNRDAFFLVGTFMAVWTIFYGIIQGWTPRILKVTSQTDTEILGQAKWWVGLLIVVPLLLAALVWLVSEPSRTLTSVIVLGLLAFGGIFAVNSSLHSFLILSFTNAKRVTMDVGFYYMSNAAGRLLGTVLSGFTYQVGGLPMCLSAATVMIGLSWIGTSQLKLQISG
ncbi:MAG: MFS transporter, partial [Rhodobacteraceae bacterium]|nr:MFS transporter [Paracoccaceae bacterium]